MVASWEYWRSFKPSEMKLKLVIFYTAFVVCIWSLCNVRRRVTVVLVVRGILK